MRGQVAVVRQLVVEVKTEVVERSLPAYNSDSHWGLMKEPVGVRA